MTEKEAVDLGWSLGQLHWFDMYGDKVSRWFWRPVNQEDWTFHGLGFATKEDALWALVEAIRLERQHLT